MFDILFPAFCIGCGKEGKYICEKCYVFAGETALICPGCDQPSYAGEAHCGRGYGLDGLASCWEYEGVVKKTLGQVKYKGITDAIQELVKTSFQMMVADQARFGTFLKFLLTSKITYVPMFLKKEKKRGFNQAKLIAKEIANIAGVRVEDLLLKTKDTQTQTKLAKEERAENVRDSFALRETSFQMTEPHPPAGRMGSVLSARPGRASEDSFEKEFSSLPERILLVDDIWTTGATMRECCKILKKAGVKEVWGFTLARTP